MKEYTNATITTNNKFYKKIRYHPNASILIFLLLGICFAAIGGSNISNTFMKVTRCNIKLLLNGHEHNLCNMW